MSATEGDRPTPSRKSPAAGNGAVGNGAVAPSASPSASSTTDARWKGRLVKRFKLVDELGEGAMGRVFVAEDTVLKRHVALKLLPAKFKDGRPNHRTERLIKEARSAASLEHPNVVSVYEIDQSGGVHYIAMELAEGGNLEQLIQLSGPMEVERACQLVAEAAEALAHAHKRGIVHRDVKPANLLLTRNGRCKVCDFGLALYDEGTDQEGRLRCVGTPNYIAPEVAQGKGAAPASDIYSLGCTLFFMLTGRGPFSGTNAREVMKQHISQPLPDMRKWRPDLPDKLVAAVEQACAKDPEKRYDSADRFAKVLRTFTIPTATSASGAMASLAAAVPTPAPAVQASGGGGIGGGSGSGTYLQESQMAPISAAQLAAIMPMPEKDHSRSAMHSPIVWAGVGTVAAAALIALGVWISRQSASNANAAPSGAASPAPVAPAPVAATPAVAAPVAVSPAVAPAHAASAAPAIASDTVAGENALLNGSVEARDDNGNPTGWYIADRCRPHVDAPQEVGNRFLRVTNDDRTTTIHADQKIDVDPTWKQVTVSARMRASGFKAGKNASGVSYWFQDEQGKQAGKLPPQLVITEDSPWTDKSVTVDVPAGAKRLYLQCVISYANGTIDFDDVKIVPQIKK
jgi:hypothetical protein